MDFGPSAAAAASWVEGDESAVDWDTLARRVDTFSSRAYFANYFGHKLPLLATTVRHLRAQRDDNRIVFFVGDSSLDAKHWLFPDPDDKELGPHSLPARRGYEKSLLPPVVAVPDACHWFNARSEERKSRFVAVNTAVEASTLKDRTGGGRSLGQDLLVRDSLREQDAIVVSVGGNDIALRPSLSTMAAVAWLALAAGDDAVRTGTAAGYGRLRQMFSHDLTAYLQMLTSKTKPSKIILCCIYYPCESGQGWADPLLNLLGYRAENEAKCRRVQQLLDTVFRDFISTIKLDGVEIIPVALGRVLNASNPAHYENRVEPSVEGCRLMGQTFLDILEGDLHESMFVK